MAQNAKYGNTRTDDTTLFLDGTKAPPPLPSSLLPKASLQASLNMSNALERFSNLSGL